MSINGSNCVGWAAHGFNPKENTKQFDINVFGLFPFFFFMIMVSIQSNYDLVSGQGCRFGSGPSVRYATWAPWFTKHQIFIFYFVVDQVSYFLLIFLVQVWQKIYNQKKENSLTKKISTTQKLKRYFLSIPDKCRYFYTENIGFSFYHRTKI